MVERAAQCACAVVRRDTDVTITNVRHCQPDPRASGVDSPLIDLGEIGHFPSGILGIPAVLGWFGAVIPRAG
jgi:hypothetical protein